MSNEIINERLLYPSYEIIGGKKIMAAAPNLDHSDIVGRIHFCFVKYFLEHNNGYVYPDGVEIHLSDGSVYEPDLCVVLKENEKILAGRRAIFGAPDMVVEVLSRSTKKRDITIKKDTYEAHGVKEYWIVNPWDKSVTVYLLRDGKYFLDEVYAVFDEIDLDLMNDEEKAAIKYEVPVSICDGLKIPVEFVFSWGY